MYDPTNNASDTVQLEVSASDAFEIQKKANALQQLATCGTEALELLAEIAKRPGAEEKLLKNKQTLKMII